MHDLMRKGGLLRQTSIVQYIFPFMPKTSSSPQNSENIHECSFEESSFV